MSLAEEEITADKGVAPNKEAERADDITLKNAGEGDCVGGSCAIITSRQEEC